MALQRPLQSLSDDELVRSLENILARSRGNEAELVAHIGEVERRRLYARSAAPSMFVYCTSVLHLSEPEAYLRIAVARAAREHPVLLEMLADGRLHLSGINILAPHLTAENRGALLGRAIHRCKRQIEELVAEISPRPDVPAAIRRLPCRGIAAVQAAGETEAPKVELRPDGVPPLALPPPSLAGPAARPALVEPLSPARYKVQFTAGADLYDKLERLRALLRHEVPDGDLATVIDRAVTRELERREARRFAQTKSPRKGAPRKEAPADRRQSSRYGPAAVRRVVWKRDEGQCGFVDALGRRCPERHRLEYHHRRPFGLGGGWEADNIGLLCRAHNRYLAELDYGRKAMSRHERGRRTVATAVPISRDP